MFVRQQGIQFKEFHPQKLLISFCENKKRIENCKLGVKDRSINRGQEKKKNKMNLLLFEEETLPGVWVMAN